jgi:hypothetical protein
MDEQTIYLTTDELAQRWRTSPESLRFHRHVGKGPRSVKFGRRVLYRVDDVESYEREQLEKQNGDGDGARAA